MVNFKVLKYKHQKQANQLNTRVGAGLATDEEVLSFVISLVAGWDFLDAETGEPLPLSDAAIEEISLPQYTELMAAFNAQMGVRSEVPKESA